MKKSLVFVMYSLITLSLASSCAPTGSTQETPTTSSTPTVTSTTKPSISPTMTSTAKTSPAVPVERQRKWDTNKAQKTAYFRPEEQAPEE